MNTKQLNIEVLNFLHGSGWRTTTQILRDGLDYQVNRQVLLNRLRTLKQSGHLKRLKDGGTVEWSTDMKTGTEGPSDQAHRKRQASNSITHCVGLSERTCANCNGCLLRSEDHGHTDDLCSLCDPNALCDCEYVKGQSIKHAATCPALVHQ